MHSKSIDTEYITSIKSGGMKKDAAMFGLSWVKMRSFQVHFFDNSVSTNVNKTGILVCELKVKNFLG